MNRLLTGNSYFFIFNEHLISTRILNELVVKIDKNKQCSPFDP